MTMPSQLHRRPAAVCLVAALLSSLAVKGQEHPVTSAAFAAQQTSDANETIHLNLGRALVLTTKVPLKRVYIGDPSLLQTFTSSSQELVLTAKALGRSSLVLWDTAGRTYTYSVCADMDAEGSRAAFREAFPTSTIAVDGREGKLFLSGTVTSDAQSDAAFKLASVYSKEVVNALKVVPVHGKQVELKLRIIEVDRAKAEQFGINFLTGGRTASSLSTQQFATGIDTSTIATGNGITITDPLNLLLYNYKLNLGISLKDAESKQILQVLAEPTLTTMSGVAARFLSGGEFPVPVVQGGTGNSTAISIMYRPYGVKVDFTPTVNADGTIHLKVNPEVSALDYTNSVTISGTTVPALSTRRAETEVEIRDGESFIVSGLLDHRTTDSLANIPGISNIPILGQLFRSKNINHSVVELVVLVTASVVDPLNKPQKPVEPVMVVPNLDSGSFDANVRKLVKADPLPRPPETGPSTNSYVEICAVTREDDAEMVLSSLRHRGYMAQIVKDDQDARLHVRTGLYATQQEAKVVQEKLLADGFSATVQESGKQGR